MPFLIAPGHMSLQNVKMGKGLFAAFSRFLRFFDRFVDFLRFSARFLTVDKVVSDFAKTSLTTVFVPSRPPF